jgi:anti-anti-sigma factor
MAELSPRDAGRTAILQIEQLQDDRGVVLELRGELDLSSADELERRLAAIATRGPGRLVIDLRDLDFMDSTGLASMVRARQSAEAAGRQFALRAGRRQVHRLFEVTGMVDLFTFIDGDRGK